MHKEINMKQRAACQRIHCQAVHLTAARLSINPARSNVVNGTPAPVQAPLFANHHTRATQIYHPAPITAVTLKNVIRPSKGLTPFSKPWRPVSLSVQNASVGDRLT